MSKDIMDIALYLIIAAIIVLIIMNAKNFATSVSGLGGSVNDTLKTISGSNYGK